MITISEPEPTPTPTPQPVAAIQNLSRALADYADKLVLDNIDGLDEPITMQNLIDYTMVLSHYSACDEE